jgi:glycyl-tRNA synthetase beta chain
VQQKLMPVAVALDAAGKPTPALLKKLAAWAPMPIGGAAAQAPAPDGKAEALFLDSLVPARRWPRACRRRSTRRSAKLPIPKVMSYQLSRRLEQRELRAPGAQAGGAARRRPWCRSRRWA